MITLEMSTEEVLNELRKDYDYVMARKDGLTKKNDKKLKSKCFKYKDILSESTYLVPETKDTVVVYAMKMVQTINRKEFSYIYLNYYIQTSYGTFIITCTDPHTERVTGYWEFTSHSLTRMIERLGKDFSTFYREDLVKKNGGAVNWVKYSYNGDDNEAVAHVGDGFLILQITENDHKIVVKTILGQNDLHTNQILDKLKSKIASEKSWNEFLYQLDTDVLQNFKAYKNCGLLKRMDR